jgi:carbonic anhydrase
MSSLNRPRVAPRLDLGLRARARAWRSAARAGGLSAEAAAGAAALGLSVPLALLLAPQTGLPQGWLVVSAIVASAVVALFGGTSLSLSGPGLATAGAVAVMGARHGAGSLVLACAACGLLQVAVGALGLGRFVRLVPLPVVAAFVTAMGGWVLLLAAPHALGLPPAADLVALHALDHLLAGRSEASLAALAVAGLTCAATLAGRRFLPRAPVGLVVIALAGAAVAVTGLPVPCLPALAFTPAPALAWPAAHPLQFAGAVLLLWVLASAETLLSSISDPRGSSGESRPDPDQDLIGHGLANVALAFVGGVPATGAAIRGDALRRAGGRGPLAALAHALLGLAALAVLLPVGRFVPLAALAGVVIAHALALLAPAPWRAILAASRGQAALGAVACAAMVGKGLIAGIETGLALSLIAALRRVGRVRITVHRGAAGAPHQITFSGPLTFLAAPRLEALEEELAALDPGGGVILDLRDVPTMDFTGARRLAGLAGSVVDRGGRLALLGTPPVSRDLLLGADPRNLVAMRLAVTEAEVDQILERPRSFELRAHVVASLDRFREQVRERYEPLFERLAESQAPHTLFIGCVDSRVTPAMLTGTHPGELFVVRCLGAIVVPPGGIVLGGEAAAIEYAVGVLGVRNIVVCGHSRCGAIRALGSGQAPPGLESLARWLRVAAPAAGDLSAAPDFDQAARNATVQQLENLRRFPQVRAGLEGGTLRLHAWFYDVGRGELYEWREDERAFMVLQGAQSAG